MTMAKHDLKDTVEVHKLTPSEVAGVLRESLTRRSLFRLATWFELDPKRLKSMRTKDLLDKLRLAIKMELLAPVRLRSSIFTVGMPVMYLSRVKTSRDHTREVWHFGEVSEVRGLRSLDDYDAGITISSVDGLVGVLANDTMDVIPIPRVLYGTINNLDLLFLITKKLPVTDLTGGSSNTAGGWVESAVGSVYQYDYEAKEGVVADEATSTLTNLMIHPIHLVSPVADWFEELKGIVQTQPVVKPTFECTSSDVSFALTDDLVDVIEYVRQGKSLLVKESDLAAVKRGIPEDLMLVDIAQDLHMLTLNKHTEEVIEPGMREDLVSMGCFLVDVVSNDIAVTKHPDETLNEFMVRARDYMLGIGTTAILELSFELVNNEHDVAMAAVKEKLVVADLMDNACLMFPDKEVTMEIIGVKATVYKAWNYLYSNPYGMVTLTGYANEVDDALRLVKEVLPADLCATVSCATVSDAGVGFAAIAILSNPYFKCTLEGFSYSMYNYLLSAYTTSKVIRYPVSLMMVRSLEDSGINTKEDALAYLSARLPKKELVVFGCNVSIDGDDFVFSLVNGG
jgi:hypothetical protein